MDNDGLIDQDTEHKLVDWGGSGQRRQNKTTVVTDFISLIFDSVHQDDTFTVAQRDSVRLMGVDWQAKREREDAYRAKLIVLGQAERAGKLAA